MMLEPTEILDRTTGVFRDLFDDPSLVLSSGMTAADIPDWDSLMHVNLMIALENEFGIKFALGEIQTLQNVGQMLELLAEKTAR